MGVSTTGLAGGVRKIPGASRLDDTVSGTILYFAEAVAGTLNADARWQIQRITFPTPGEDDSVVEWADGDLKFDNIWDDRAALSYT